MTQVREAEDFDSRIQKSVLPVFLQRDSELFEPIGTCFVVVAAGRSALALSARHVFDYAAHEEGAVAQYHHLPLDFRPAPPSAVRLRRTKLWAVYTSQHGRYHLVDISQLSTGADNDVAVCHLTMADPNERIIFDERLSLRSAPVAVGSFSALVGCSALGDFSVVESPSGTSQFRLPLERRLIAGTCIERLPRGRGNFPGPSFTVDQSSIHGMSGGPIFSGGKGEEALVCGIVSHGASYAPLTTGAELWPMYGLRIGWLENNEGQAGSLLELARMGGLDDRSNPDRHIRMVHLDGQRTQVEWHSI